MKRGLLLLIFILIIILTNLFIIKGKITGLAEFHPTNVSVTIANTPPSLGQINNSIFVCESKVLDYDFNATDIDSDDLTISIFPEDPFYIYPSSFSGQSNINSNIISGVLTKTNAGGNNSGSQTYAEIINLNDGLTSDTAKTNITVIEINNAPFITHTGVQTIYTSGDNSTFYSETQATDLEEGDQNSGNLEFNVSILNSSGDSVNLFNISSTGIINFTANSSYIGVYSVTICVNDTGIDNPHENISDFCNQDGSTQTTCDDFTLTVTDENRNPTITDYTPTDLNQDIFGTDTLNFEITKNDKDGTIPDTYWYVDDNIQEYDSGSSTDSFSYSFGCGISGNHNVIVEITDGIANSSLQWDFNITEVECGTSASTGGGSKGGGGAAEIVEKDFSVSKKIINVSLRQGESKMEIITIKNNEEKDLNFIILNKNLEEFITLSEEKFTLGPKEEKNIIIDFEAEEETLPNLYLGELDIISGTTKKSILVSIEVKSQEISFEIIVELLNHPKTILPGEEITANITIYNSGDIEEMDLSLEYVILNKRADEILLEKETIQLKDKINLIKKFKIPLDIRGGEYILYVKATYGDQVGSSSIWFSAEEPLKQPRYYILTITILSLITIGIIIFIIILKRKKIKENIPYAFKPTKI